MTVNSAGSTRSRAVDREATSRPYRRLHWHPRVGRLYVEALQVDIEKTFWRLLEKRLSVSVSSGLAKNIDVINL